MNPSAETPFIFIGASAGGVYAMLDLVTALPAGFPAPIFFVQHIGSMRSHLPDLLNTRGPNRALTARDGDVPQPGTIYIAPSDHHMLLEGGVVRLSRGPKEHHARPAIDPLFRSAALDCGARAVGVVLTGMLDDGTAGLRAIKDCGGIAVVQDPEDAYEPSMPRSALACVEVDHVVPLGGLGALLCQLAQPRARRLPVLPPMSWRREHALGAGDHNVENLMAIADPSTFTCPDCGGVLFELKDKRPVRYRCHTGHAFSLRSLAHTQEQTTDAALWAALRTLQEKESILRHLADLHQGSDAQTTAQALREADELAIACSALRRLTEKSPSPESFGAP
ncbi:chemotaxis protein CheB [Paracidovorax valerianellae]|uniref:protein-glutamate methylesterase n=1 Tax=Paracidovorax valerianellae TaxID=187868 RepID=A0A1G6YN42_9BURK|nr:chemotaxis protein CheB [Paracidovorax valerianellae]MDA8447399.1 chemotaxis protein CheB [Paracidovorax valerianellae]SDD91087.1 two-component system, chemotaxis family, response regulator CheB [Paracidovorax valerianellae]